MGAKTNCVLSAHCSTLGGRPSPGRVSRPLNSTPCFRGVTPVTSVVWLIHVTEGFETVIALACEPSAASLRKLGSGSEGSFQKRAGKPSMVTRRTGAL